MTAQHKSKRVMHLHDMHRLTANSGVQDLRIDFQFDRAAFDFKFLPFKVPYPVPFKLFGDETKVCPLSLGKGMQHPM